MDDFLTLSFCLIFVTDPRLYNYRFSSNLRAYLGTVMCPVLVETLKTMGTK